MTPERLMTRRQKLRQAAYELQGGHCHYCNAPMWRRCKRDIWVSHGITRKEANHFQATAEHLIAQCDGGQDTAENIVAACKHCNHTRHHPIYPGQPVTVDQYLAFVRDATARDAWLTTSLIAAARRKR